MTDLRPVEELTTLTECVEEVLIAVKYAYAKASIPLTQTRADQIGYTLYDQVEAIIKRAQELPREDAHGSSSQTAQQLPPV